MALVTTPGAADATSYATLAEALAHVATLTYTGKWPTVEAAQEALLKQAALRMNTLGLKGTRVASEELQSLAFPRYGLEDSSGFVVPSDIIPRSVKTAQIELAIWLGQKNRNADQAPASLKLGTLAIEGQTQKAFPPHVLALLRPFLSSYGSCVRLERA